MQFKKRILVQFRQVRKINSKITGEFNQNITGVRVVKALGREEANLAEFSALTDQMYRASYRAAWLSALFLPAVQLISAFAVGGIVLYGGLSATVGGMTIGAIQAFVSYVTFMMWPVQDSGARLLRDAERHRFGRAHFLVGRCAAGGGGPGRRVRSRHHCR